MWTVFTCTLLISSLSPALAQETKNPESVRVNDYSYYPSYFNDTITKSYRLTLKGDYKNAALLFSRPDDTQTIPLDFQRDTFTSSQVPSQIKRDVQRNIDSVKNLLEKYGALHDSLKNVVQPVIDAISKGDMQAAALAQANALPVLNEFIRIRNSVAQNGWQLDTIFTDLKNSRTIQDADYLSYATKFIIGTGRTKGTGILGAMDKQWEEMVKSVTVPLQEKAGTLTAPLVQALNDAADLTTPFPKEAIESSVRNLIPVRKLLSDYAELNNRITYRNTDGRTVDAKPEYYTTFDSSVSALELLLESCSSMTDLADQITSRIKRLDDFIDKSVADISQDIRDKEDTATSFYIDISNTLAALSQDAEKKQSDTWITTVRGLPQSAERWTDAVDAYTNLCASLSKAALQKSSEAIIAAGSRLIDAGKQMYVEGTEKYHALMNLIPDASRSDARQYPGKLLSSINTFSQYISLDVSTLQANSDMLSSGGIQYRSNIQYMQRKIGESIADIKALASQTESLAEQARTQRREALQAQNQIYIYYNRAEQAFRQGNYTSARSNLDRAGTLYDNTLASLKRDAGIEEETYERITSLKQKIAEKQKPLLVQEIRVYKNRAKTAYYAGNFEEASVQISEAESTRENWGKFMDVELEADQELDRLKNLINTALALKSGKELDKNDPLYPEMSQILSIANQLYTQGRNLMAEGKKSEGKAALTQAKNKLNELRIVYPRNQKANLLSMRIDQVMDLNQFNATFKTRLDELRMVNYANNDSVAREAYSDLQDLHEISPDYPGLSDLLYKAELSLGIRAKPIDNSSKIEAQNTALQAQAKLKEAGRDSVQLAEAKRLANQALALNPDNDIAISVLDEIALRTGSDAAVVLSASDEALYQQAVTQLQSGNVIAANASLQSLLKKASNRRSAKVQKLQTRIEGMLN